MFKKKKQPESIKDLVKVLSALDSRLLKAEEKIQELEKENKIVVKRTSLVRYDAYNQAGGNQSFSLALLNDMGNGSLITGLFKEGTTRVFVKNIQEGTSESALSPEEEKAIKNAVK